MWRIWTVVPRWKAVLSLVILNGALLWLYYREEKKLDPDFVMYSASADTVGITPIMEEEKDVDRAMLKFWMPMNRKLGKPILNRPQGWQNESVTIFTVEILNPASNAARALNCTPCSKPNSMAEPCIRCPSVIVNGVPLRHGRPANSFNPSPKPNMTVTYISADGVARTGTKDWSISPFWWPWDPKPETEVKRLRYLIGTGDDWIDGGFGFEVLYRNGALYWNGEAGEDEGENEPEILGLDMGWWGLNPYKRFEKAGDEELQRNLQGWSGVRENWVLYVWRKNGRRSWGPLEFREGWWKRYGRHSGGVKGW